MTHDLSTEQGRIECTREAIEADIKSGWDYNKWRREYRKAKAKSAADPKYIMAVATNLAQIQIAMGDLYV